MTTDEIEIIRILSNILDALDYVHSLNIIHRDVKLENVMISSERVYLIDFGSAIHVNANKVPPLGTKE